MKKLLSTLLISILSFSSYAQITYEKGYIINNAGEKIECFIKNNDWSNNPTHFEYKNSENSESNTGTIENIKEFGVYNNFKYQQYTVDIDKSPEHNINNLNGMSRVKNPIFNKEQLYLKVLVEGEIILYSYTDGTVKRFFYSIGNTNPKPLIFKNYRIQNRTLIAENNTYKQQLLNILKCENITKKEINNLNHKKQELIDIFLKYNNCNNPDFAKNKNEKKERKNAFNLNIRPGLSSSSISITSTNNNIGFDNKLNFRLGIESEFILNFNNNKWAFIAEPIYNTSYKSEIGSEVDEFFTQIVTAEYKSLDLALGGRYYLFINQNSKFFINISYVLGIDLKSEIVFESFNRKVETVNAPNLVYGLGYKYNNFSVEFRYLDKRNITPANNSENIDYTGFSFIVGYSIF